MTNNAPIGVFDSGLGGISVVNEIHKHMPHEDIVFYGDSAHAPYGVKSTKEVQELSTNVVEHLLSHNAKAIVIACNTATSAASHLLREKYDIPIIGMEPALKPACDMGHGSPQNIVVMATELTLREKKFADLMNRFSTTHHIVKQPCPRLVEIVENGQIEDESIVYDALHEYLDSYDMNSLNSVVLGCTHFTYYKKYLRSLLPSTVHIIDGNEGTARHLHEVLSQSDNLAERHGDGNILLENSIDDSRMLDLSHYFVSR